MTPQIAAAESAVLLSVVKPIVFMIVVLTWGRLVCILDADQQYYLLPRWLWNPLQVGAGVAGFGLWLLIPYFWLGLPVAILLLSGAIVAYVSFRNPKVPEPNRWTLSMDMITRRLAARQHAQVQRHATVAMLEASGDKIEVPSPVTPFGQAHMRLTELMDFALPRGANRVDIRLDAKAAAITVQVDGFGYQQPPIDPKSALTLVNYLKASAKLDTEDLRRRQTGTIPIQVGNQSKHTLSLLTAGTPRDLRMTVFIDPQKLATVGLDQLGLLPSQRQVLDPILSQGAGVVLAACPPHEGLTTSLYTFMHGHDPYTRSVVTLEDEIAYQVEGVDHQTLEMGTDNATVARYIIAALRRQPHVLLIGRPLSPETAKGIVHDARSVRFYAGVHQIDAFHALATWLKMVEDPRMAAEALSAVAAHRLVRVLCTTCRASYRPDPEALRKLNIPPDRVAELHKHSGRITVGNKQVICPDCSGMGYRGRQAIFEVIGFDDQARELVAANQLDQLRGYLRKQQKMIWLQEAALARVVDHTTSISEINRVLAPKPVRQPGDSRAGQPAGGQ